MGAWGVGTWENDAALDWLAEVAAGRGSVRAALGIAGDQDDGCAALAAAELVAAACGRPGADLPARARALATADLADRSTVEAALAAVDAVERGSELQRLWDEGGRDDEWHDAVAELRSRLRMAAP